MGTGQEELAAVREGVIVKEAYLVGAALLAGARLTVDYGAGKVLIEQT
jgi:hypothetical protein